MFYLKSVLHCMIFYYRLEGNSGLARWKYLARSTRLRRGVPEVLIHTTGNYINFIRLCSYAQSGSDKPGERPPMTGIASG